MYRVLIDGFDLSREVYPTKDDAQRYIRESGARRRAEYDVSIVSVDISAELQKLGLTDLVRVTILSGWDMDHIAQLLNGKLDPPIHKRIVDYVQDYST